MAEKSRPRAVETRSLRRDALMASAARLPGALGLLLVVTDPLGRDRAQPLANLRRTPAHLLDGFLDPGPRPRAAMIFSASAAHSPLSRRYSS